MKGPHPPQKQKLWESERAKNRNEACRKRIQIALKQERRGETRQKKNEIEEAVSAECERQRERRRVRERERDRERLRHREAEND